MAIALRGTPTGAGAALVTSISCNVPTGVVAGDLLIWNIAQGIATNPTTDPAGWTRIDFETTTNDSSDNWYRIADGTEPASYTSPTLSSGQTATSMAAFSGVDNLNPFDITTPANSAGTTTIPFPAVTPVTAGAWIIAIAAIQFAANATVGTITSSNTTMMTSNASTGAASSVHAISAMSRFAWSSGAFTPAMSSSQATNRTLGQSLVLRPAFPQIPIRSPFMRQAVNRSLTY